MKETEGFFQKMPYQKILFLDSAKASIKDLANGKATFILREPFGEVPDAMVAASSFSFTNWFINVTSAINSKIYYSDDPANETKYFVDIPTGSYSFADLNTYVQNQVLADRGFAVFQFVANFSTNKVAVQFANVAGWYVHFQADSPFTLLGFANPQNVPVGKANVAFYLEYAASTAAFNNITSIKVCTNLTNDSVSNTNQSPVILQTTPLVSVGSTQTSEVQNLLWMASTPLHDKVTEIRVWILNQLDVPLAMSEDFTLTLIVKN